MTANELANKLDEIYTGTDYEDIKLAATMLRQQAQEIKELALQKLSDIGQMIEQKPVAWMTENGTIYDELPPIAGGLIPLYTHANEDRDSAIYATGYWNGIEYKKQHDELKTLVKSFFEDYLDYQEESDSGRVFNPIHVSCTRVMMVEPLAKLLIRMRELSGVKE